MGEDLLDDEKWYYKDPKGQERGPFGKIQMDKWVKYDFFKVDLLVRREYQLEYIHLGDIFFSEQRNPFTGEPLMEWFQGPSSEFKTSLMLLIQNFLLNRISRPDLDVSTSTATSSGYIPPNPGYYTTLSNMSNLYSSSSTTKDPTPTPTPTPVTINNTPNQETPVTVPSEVTQPKFNWWESSDAIPKRSQNPNLEKSSTIPQASESDWEQLLQKQTEAVQKMLEGMKQANEEIEKKQQHQLQNSKKKKGKKKEPQAPSITTSQKKSKSVKLNNTQYKTSGKSNNTQKNPKPPPQPSSEIKTSNNTKPQTARLPIQTSGKPKPQYKLKDTSIDSNTNPIPNPLPDTNPPPPVNPNINPLPNTNPPPPVNPNPAVIPSSPSQTKRLHSKPVKVWKVVEKKEEILNPEPDQPQLNIEHPAGDEEKTTQSHL
jgi:hypothetical protein